jgi:hypothetical protein
VNPLPTPLTVPVYWEVARYYSLETVIGLNEHYIDHSGHISDLYRDGGKRVSRRRLTETWQARGYPLPHPNSRPLVVRAPELDTEGFKVGPGRIMEVHWPDHWAPDGSTPYRPVEVLTEPESTSEEADRVSESKAQAAHPTSIEGEK